MKEFNLEIVTPDGVAFFGKAISLITRTSDGDVEIMAGHIDYIASLGTGRTRIKTAEGERFASSSGGFLTVSGGEVKLVPITFAFGEDIDLGRARLAKERAEEMLRNAKDREAIDLAKAKLSRAISRISVAEAL